MTRSQSENVRPSVLRELRKHWGDIVWYWDFLGGVALALVLFGADWLLPAGAAGDLRGQVAQALHDVPNLALAALALAIATLTFLSSIAHSKLFQSAARAGALTDFATFSWWEGFIAVLSMAFAAALPALPARAAYVGAGLSLYVVLGLLSLLLRLTHIVYRHAGALATDD